MRLSIPAVLAVGALSFLFGTLMPSTAAQDSRPRYLLLDFMKVPSGGENAYLQVERDWKALHEERVRAGKIAWWALYGARMPTGTSREYDFITMTAYHRFQDLENSITPEILTKALKGKDVNELMTRTNASRSVVRDEVLVLVDQVGQP